MPKQAKTHKIRQRQKFQFIELIVYWEGLFYISYLQSFFNISRQSASKALAEYKKLYPANLVYDTAKKSYLRTISFNPQFITGHVNEYLNMVISISSIGLKEEKLLSRGSLNMPERHVSTEVMRALIYAVKNQSRVEVDYVSLSNPNREGRIICPHSFVNTGQRWHIRAWCEKNQDFRDFVLSRFKGIPDILGKSTNFIEQDLGWNTQLTLVLRPDHRLSKAKQKVLEDDYAMKKGKLEVKVRACLAHYFLQELRVGTKMLDGTPEAQQLVLENRSEIEPWLFS